jgi:hypothetical protein
MCHLAMLEGTGNGDGTTWLEPVTDDQVIRALSRMPIPYRDEPWGTPPATASRRRARGLETQRSAR